MHKKKVKKPYRPLDEVYLKESFAKPVPPLPRQIINEASLLVYSTDHPEGKPYENIDDETAKKIVNMLDRSAPQDIEGRKISVDGVIAECLEIDGWATAGQGSKSSVFREVVNVFERVKLNYSQFSKLLGIQTDKNNLIRTVLLQDTTVRTINDIVPKEFKLLFVTPDDAFEVIKGLWHIYPESDANVGPGELALTLMSDGRKGVGKSGEGDLVFEGLGSVEVKGNNAALGSGKVANEETYNELNKILQAKTNTTIQALYIDVQKQKILDYIQGLIKRYTVFINSKEYTPEENNNFQNILKKLTALSENINLAKSMEEIIQDIRTSGLPETKTGARTGKVTKGEQAELLDLAAVLQGLHKGEVTSDVGGKKSKFLPAVKAFFKNKNISTKDRIDASKFLRSSSRTNQEQIAQVATEMLENYPNLLTWVSDSSESDLHRFIGAIHVAEYQQEKKFKYIIFFNGGDKKDSKAPPSKIVSLDFSGTGNTFKEDIKRVFEFFKRKDINASIKLGVDETRGTVRVAIT